MLYQPRRNQILPLYSKLMYWEAVQQISETFLSEQLYNQCRLPVQVSLRVPIFPRRTIAQIIYFTFFFYPLVSGNRVFGFVLSLDASESS